MARDLFLRPRSLYEDERGRFAWVEVGIPVPIPEFMPEKRSPIVGTLHVYDRGKVDVLWIQSDELKGFYHPLRRLGWGIAQMGQGRHSGCIFATTDQVLYWLQEKGVLS